MTVARERWGSLPDGGEAELFTLEGPRGMRVRVSNYGCIVQSISVPDREGELRNVALGFPATDAGLERYRTAAGHFGAIAGRYANRIARHSFVLEGREYALVGNNGPNDVNTLHGGPDAYHKQLWTASVEGDALLLEYLDPDGKNGFPGTVRNSVRYEVTDDAALRISYRASTDTPTVINLTNHSYFNLEGEGSGNIYDQVVAINAERYLRTDELQIPTGELAGVEGTPFDFRAEKPIGWDIARADMPGGEQLLPARGYDHTWVLSGTGDRLAAVAFDRGSGISLQVYTDQPGVQFYSGNMLFGDLVGTSGRVYRQGAGFALETQHFPDAPHHIGESEWPSVVLRPGEAFTSTTAFHFALRTGELDALRF